MSLAPKLIVNLRIAGASLLCASVLAGCGGSTAPYGPSPANPSAANRSRSDAAVAAWSRSVVRVALPSAGCFTASYPTFAWSRVACATPPKLWFPLPRQNAIHANLIGNGNDYTIVTLPQTMSAAVGSFPAVTGVKTVRSKDVPPFGGKGTSGPNVYSLQLNSNFFSTAACAGMLHCAGWEQFVYTNQPGAYKGGGNLIIQDWLLSTTRKNLAGCPPNAGWEKAGGSGCVQNGPHSVLVPDVPITELRALSLSGSAASTGDSAFLAVGSIVYGMKNIQGGGITDLNQHWTGAEFNIVGNGGGTRAMFNSGATITVSVEADTGSATSPTCRERSGTTGESNNLSFVAAPANPTAGPYPSIQFTESNAGGGSPSCVAIPAL
jgi:hypothetical protein